MQLPSGTAHVGSGSAQGAQERGAARDDRREASEALACAQQNNDAHTTRMHSPARQTRVRGALRKLTDGGSRPATRFPGRVANLFLLSRTSPCLPHATRQSEEPLCEPERPKIRHITAHILVLNQKRRTRGRERDKGSRRERVCPRRCVKEKRRTRVSMRAYIRYTAMRGTCEIENETGRAVCVQAGQRGPEPAPPSFTGSCTVSSAPSPSPSHPPIRPRSARRRRRRRADVAASHGRP